MARGKGGWGLGGGRQMGRANGDICNSINNKKILKRKRKERKPIPSLDYS